MSPIDKRRASNDDTDAELVAAAQQGDQQAFAILVGRYRKKVLQDIGRRMRGPGPHEDVAQEVFVGAWRGLAGLREGKRFRGWLSEVTHGAVARAQLRARKDVLTCSVRNSSEVRMSISWSRLVTRPWILALRKDATSLRIACSRVGACAMTFANIAS